LRVTPAPKVRPAAASAAAPAGTLRATTTMRAALPLKATNTRADRAEERAMVKALRAQIAELNAEMAVASAEAERALAEERQRVDRLNEQVAALSAEVVRAEKQAEAVMGRAEQAEGRRGAEHDRAEALRTAIDELKAGEAMTMDMHARGLALARHEVLAAQQAAAELRRMDEARKARGLVARLRPVWRGE
jgi:chromosome segregation ATPase